MSETASRPGASAEPPGIKSEAEDRARILLELLREQRPDHRLKGLISDARGKAGVHPVPSQEALRKSARELLDRIGHKSRPRPAPAGGAMQPGVLRSTVAALIDGKTLAQEHPAIIAMVIEHQDRKTQASVLRSMPGRKARKVQRALRMVARRIGE